MTELYPVCKSCHNFNVDERPCKWCIDGDLWDKKIVKTNADNVREMSDDELADFIEEACCPPEMMWKPPYECDKDMCTKCWLDWLLAEAKE